MRRPVQAQPGDVQQQDLLLESADCLVITQHQLAKGRSPKAPRQYERQGQNRQHRAHDLAPQTMARSVQPASGCKNTSELRQNATGRVARMRRASFADPLSPLCSSLHTGPGGVPQAGDLRPGLKVKRRGKAVRDSPRIHRLALPLEHISA